MSRITKIEQAIRDTGAIQYGEFTAHNGEQGNCKIVLDELFNNDQHIPLRDKIVKSLARKLGPFEPEIFMPMPEGANILGILLARELGARAILLQWQDKPAGRLKFKDQHERIVACRAQRIALIDDVRRTDSTFLQAVASIELGNKELVGAVVFDRSSPRVQPGLEFEVVSVVKRFIPLRVKLDMDSK